MVEVAATVARIGTRAKRVATVVPVLSAIAVGMVFGAGGCRDTSHHDPKVIKRTETRRILTQLVGLTDYAVGRSGKYPPTEQLVYVQWLVQWCGDKLREYRIEIDIQKGEILDGWGRPIVLVVDRIYPVGLGSRGSNGLWECTGSA